MKTHLHRTLMVLLATLLGPAPTLALAADPASGAAPRSRAATADEQHASAAAMHVLRERMQEIRRTGDPTKRMQLIEAQINQLDRVIQDLDGSCPTMDLPPGMMGRNGAAGPAGGDAMLAKRLEMMEKRLDMMQLMLQRQNGTPDAVPKPRN